MQAALFYLIKTLSTFYLLTFLLRFILQWIRADFYNPISQFVLRVTNPLVVPARRVIPSAGGIDLPTFAVLLLLEFAVTWVLISLVGQSVPGIVFVMYVCLRLVGLTLWFYLFGIFVYVILRLLQAHNNPVTTILGQMVEPVLAPVRRFIPPIGAFDLTPLLVLILLQAVLISLPLPSFLR